MMRNSGRSPGRARLRPAIGITALLAAGAITLTACGSSGSSSASAANAGSTSSASTTAMTSVSIGVNAAVAGEIEPELAQTSGLFAKYGIKATVTVISSSDLLAALSSGRVQFGAFGAPQPEEGILSGSQLKWLGVWEGKPNTQLIVGPGITSIADLKGKSVGITVPGSLIDLFARLILTDNGVNPNDVTFQSLQSTTALTSAFVGGSIQATILSPPQSTTGLKKQGSKSLLDVGSKYSWPQGGLVGYMPWVTSHSAATTKVMEAIAASVNLFRSDPAAAKNAIKALAPTTTTADLNASYASALSTLATSTIVPSLTTEQFVLKSMASLYPTKYSKANPSDAASYIDGSYATAAQKVVPIKS
jgi:ABC-type nitrate/sulfonate/bicarbonate transport system substrate-binding protein